MTSNYAYFCLFVTIVALNILPKKFILFLNGFHHHHHHKPTKLIFMVCLCFCFFFFIEVKLEEKRTTLQLYADWNPKQNWIVYRYFQLVCYIWKKKLFCFVTFLGLLFWTNNQKAEKKNRHKNVTYCKYKPFGFMFFLFLHLFVLNAYCVILIATIPILI